METKGSVLCRDPVWMRDAVSRFLESPVYSVPLLDFIDENCGIFEDSDDNQLEYTIVHENFKELVDGLISDFLSSLGIPVPTFVQMLANEVHASLYSIVVTSILTVDDFLLFKELMLKRNFQISNQAVNQMTKPPQSFEVPADLNSVIDHLSDVSKHQQQSDKEAAKSLSLADAFQQQAKVNDVHSDPKPVPTIILSRSLEGENKRHEDHGGLGVISEEEHDKHEKEESPSPQYLQDDSKEVIESLATQDSSFQAEETMRETSISPVASSTVTKSAENRPKSGKVRTPELKRPTKADTTESATPVKENRKENTRATKVSFGEAAILGEPPLREKEEFGDYVDGSRCVGEERQEEKAEQAPELTTTKMIEDLIADIHEWKPKSLKLSVNDGDIQQRRRYLQHQRDRILAHKKSAREKQLRFFRQLESKADASSVRPKRNTQPTPALPRDTEANKKRETLRKELARCLKEELTNKTSNMSPTSKQMHV